MARRATVRHACTTCREKRRKVRSSHLQFPSSSNIIASATSNLPAADFRQCDGKSPCSACEARQQECRFADPSWKSKGSLRSEIDELRRKQRNNEAIIDALKSPHRWQNTLQSLQRGDSVDTITRRMSDVSSSATKLNGKAAFTVVEDAAGEDEEDDDDDFDQMRRSLDEAGLRQFNASPRWGAASVANSITDRISEPMSPLFSQSVASPTESTTVGTSIPSEKARSTSQGRSPFSAASSTSGESFVRKLSDLSFMERRLNLFLHWECPLFAMVEKDAFIRDFVSGGTTYCSSALVSAVLALATPLCDEDDEAESMSAAHSAERFAKAARKLLRDEPDPNSLTTVQTLGLLALREASKGNLSEARAMVNQCFELIMSICAAEVSHTAKPRYDKDVVSTIFSGITSLARTITVTACQLPTAPSSPSSAASPTSADVREYKSPMDAHPPPLQSPEMMTHWSQLARKRAYPRAEAAMLFQLTELVYSCLAYVHRSPIAARQQAVVYAYQRCLAWYSNTIATMGPETTCTPSVLFMQ
jgi:hypothetical protein